MGGEPPAARLGSKEEPLPSETTSQSSLVLRIIVGCCECRAAEREESCHWQPEVVGELNRSALCTRHARHSRRARLRSMDPTGSAGSPAAPVREDQVSNAVSFLLNPRVRRLYA